MEEPPELPSDKELNEEAATEAQTPAEKEFRDRLHNHVKEIVSANECGLIERGKNKKHSSLDRKKWRKPLIDFSDPTLDTDFKPAEEYARMGIVVYLLVPHAFYADYLPENGMPPCPECSSNKNVTKQGCTSHGLRSVVSLTGAQYVFAWQYRCKKCPARMQKIEEHRKRLADLEAKMRIVTGAEAERIKAMLQCLEAPPAENNNFTGANADMIKLLPKFVQNQIPLVFTAKSAIERILMELLECLYIRGLSFEAAAETLSVMKQKAHYRTWETALSHQLHVKEYKSRGGFTLAKPAVPETNTKPYKVSEPVGFGEFASIGSGSSKLTGAWLRHVFVWIAERDRYEEQQLLNAHIGGKFQKADHHFKFPKQVRGETGVMYGQLNGHHQISALHLCTTKQVTDLMPQLVERRKFWMERGIELPDAFWVDNVYEFQSALKSAFPSVQHVLADVNHFLLNLERAIEVKVGKSELMRDFARAFFVLHQPDFEHLKKFYLSKTKWGGAERWDAMPESWKKKQVRTRVPEASVLVKNIEGVEEKYAKHMDVKTGLMLLNEPAKQVLERAKDLARKNLVSDPYSLQEMYINRKDVIDKVQWVTVRSSSQLESIWRVLRTLLKGGNVSVKLVEVLLSDFVTTINIKAGIKYKGNVNYGLYTSFSFSTPSRVLLASWALTTPFQALSSLQIFLLTSSVIS